ncbi:MAG TPA: YkvA family protein [Candidatus Kapabacteria bacterium]|nr:YkvA family protein [Candidatus Kapabacteria bacterium]
MQNPRAFKSLLKNRLFQDAEHVQQSDIDELDESVPRKLGNLDMKKVAGTVSWMKTMVHHVRLLFDMVRDREFSLDGRTKALVAAGLIYFVLPVDLTPDFIPGIGYIDDAMVLTLVWRLVAGQVARYQAFLLVRAEGQEGAPSASSSTAAPGVANAQQRSEADMPFGSHEPGTAAAPRSSSLAA